MTSITLVCPRCHAPLPPPDDGGRRCTTCGAVYPRRSEVDVFLSDEEWQACRAHLDEETGVREAYARARRASPLTVLYFDRWIARLLGEIPETLGGPLVELMCGGAEVCRRLPTCFDAAVGLDLDVDMVAQAARDLRAAGNRRVTLVCGTAARLPLADACTSVVVVQGALHHARPILTAILREIHRILRPGGVLVGSEPANDHPLTRAIRDWQYRRSAMQGRDPDERGFARDELAAELARAGLRLDRYRQFGFIAYPLMGNTDLLPLLATCRSQRLGRALLALDRTLERLPAIRRLAWASLYRAFKEDGGV